jgi:hypothetical protein
VLEQDIRAVPRALATTKERADIVIALKTIARIRLRALSTVTYTSGRLKAR